jgi:hypothetical protein
MKTISNKASCAGLITFFLTFGYNEIYWATGAFLLALMWSDE